MPELLSGKMELAPGLTCPDMSTKSFADMKVFIDEELPKETPPMFGLHPNAEIGYLTSYADSLFRTIVNLGGSASSGGGSSDSGVRAVLEDLLERLPPDFVMLDIKVRAVMGGAGQGKARQDGF